MTEPRLAKSLAVLAVAGTFGLLVAGCTAGQNTNPVAGTTARPPASTTNPTATGQGRWLQMEQSGELHTMLQQHQAMMQQMQASASPQMLEIMHNDPMWQMLDSGEAVKEMEQHQADINRMLAQPGQ